MLQIQRVDVEGAVQGSARFDPSEKIDHCFSFLYLSLSISISISIDRLPHRRAVKMNLEWLEDNKPLRIEKVRNEPSSISMD